MDNLNNELSLILHSQFFTSKKKELFTKLQECLVLIEEIGMESTVEAQYFSELEMDRPLDLADLVMTATTLVGLEIQDENFLKGTWI